MPSTSSAGEVTAATAKQLSPLQYPPGEVVALMSSSFTSASKLFLSYSYGMLGSPLRQAGCLQFLSGQITCRYLPRFAFSRFFPDCGEWGWSSLLILFDLWPLLKSYLFYFLDAQVNKNTPGSLDMRCSGVFVWLWVCNC